MTPTHPNHDPVNDAIRRGFFIPKPVRSQADQIRRLTRNPKQAERIRRLTRREK